jgi:hypothetical protein
VNDRQHHKEDHKRHTPKRNGIHNQSFCFIVHELHQTISGSFWEQKSREAFAFWAEMRLRFCLKGPPSFSPFNP